MPVYEYSSHDGKKPFEVVKPISRASDPEKCPCCGGPSERVYSYSTPKEFNQFFDERYGVLVSSAKHQERLMKKHGDIYTADVPKSDRVRERIKEWKFRKNRGLA